MRRDHHDEIQTLFDELVELGAEERSERLALLAESDPTLAAEVALLLEADREADRLFQPLSELASPDVVQATHEPDEALRDALAQKYELLDVLGEGGMGTVYLARDIRHDRQVALKTIHPGLTTTEVRERFEREIQVTAQLQHPHILPLHDSGLAGDTLYYVMPYVEGESLRERLDRERQLPIDDALKIAKEVAGALGHAHSLGVVHRDVKPANILLEEGHAVVADFGIAKAVSEASEEHLTKTGTSVGTPSYISPEQASGTEEVDGRADLYSLACVLYEMLAGDPPYTASTPRAMIARHMADRLPNLRVVRDTVPEPIAQAIEKALAKSPADRYETAEAFAEALAKGKGAPAAAPRKKRVVRGVAGVLAIAAIVGGGIVAVGIGFGPWQSPGAGGRGVEATEPRFEQVTRSGQASEARISPDGRYVAYLDGLRLMLADLQATESRSQTLLPGVSHIFDLRWSPSSADLYISGLLMGDWGIFRVPKTGGTSRRLKWGDGGALFDFSPDGSRLVFTNVASRRVYIGTFAGPDSLVQKTSAEFEFIEISGDYQWLNGVAWHPSGDMLAVVTLTSSPQQSVLWVVSLKDGAQAEIATLHSFISRPRWSADGQAIYVVQDELDGESVLRIDYPSNGGPPQRVLSDCVGTSVSADGKHLVCTRTSQDDSIWRIASDHSPTRLTPAADTSLIRGYEVSPNGEWVAYTQLVEGGWDVFKVPTRGGNPQRITWLGNAAGTAWSPDGDVIAFTATGAEGEMSLWFVSADGGLPVRIEGPTMSADGVVTWAPGADPLVNLSGNRNFAIVRTGGKADSLVRDGVTITDLPMDQLVDNDSIGWMSRARVSPDGESVAVEWNRWEGNRSVAGVWLISLQDGSQQVVLPRRQEEDFAYPIGWTGDGAEIYVGREDGIFRIPKFGGEPEHVLTLPEKTGNCVPLNSSKGIEFVCVRTELTSDVWLVEGFDSGGRSPG